MKKMWYFFYKTMIFLIALGFMLMLATILIGEKEPFFLVKLDRIANEMLFSKMFQKNFLKNPSFEIDENDDGFPDNWKGENVAVSREESNDGLWSVRTKNDLTFLNNTLLEQTVNYLWPKGVKLRFTAWAKIGGQMRAGNVAGIRVRMRYINGQTDEYEAFFDSGIDEWQPVLIDFHSRYMMRRVDVIGFLNQTGVIYFDRFSLDFAPVLDEN